jgi:hypothetical protein
LPLFYHLLAKSGDFKTLFLPIFTTFWKMIFQNFFNLLTKLAILERHNVIIC